MRASAILCLAVSGQPSYSAQTVESLRYGVTLFHFFQRDYFNSLTELMTAQELQDLGKHEQGAELLRGGMSLSYGMDRVAQDIFTQLLSEPHEGVDRDQAWFYLSKLAWQRGQLDRTSEALTQMSPQYQGPVANEANYLRAAVGLRNNDEAEAQRYSELLPEDSPWLNYHYYNLGAARAARGDWAQAISYFHQVDDSLTFAEDVKALQDKAYTASGFAQMANGELAKATEDFLQVRLDSSQADRAMLGYGWALSELGDFRAALSPWYALSQRSLMNETTRESLLAIPYAYEQLGKHILALDNYKLASEIYADQLKVNGELTQSFQQDDLPALLGLSDTGSTEWLAGGDILPEGKYAPYLRSLISRHSFQLSMKELRDLHQAARHLSQAQERLAVLSQVDTDQQRVWATVMEGDRRERLQQRERELAAQTQRLRQQLTVAEQNGDDRWFADSSQAQLWQRLENSQSLSEQLGLQEQHQFKINLMRGQLIWQDSENYPARRWRVNQSLKELESLAEQASTSLSKVDLAMTSRRSGGFSPRIEQLLVRVEQQQARTQLAIQSSESQIRTIALNELEHQSRELVKALGQSKLAMARLYDRGSAGVTQ